MDDVSTSTDPGRVARRLRRLIDHLRMTDAEFANATGLKASYLSRLLSGERGASGNASTLFLATRERLALSGHYWSAREDVDPAECVSSTPQEEGRRMATRQTVDMRAGLAQLAAERDDPPEVVKQIMLTQPPAHADALWWVRRYLDLVDAHKA